MTNKIENSIKEAINESLNESLHAIIFNLSNVFGGLLYSLKLEDEKIGGVGDISNLIAIIIRTSTYTGPSDEEYPTWDEDKGKKIIERLTHVLQKHGIQQSWNIGREYQSPSTIKENLS